MLNSKKMTIFGSIAALLIVAYVIVNASLGESKSDVNHKSSSNGFSITNIKSVGKPTPNKAVDFTWEENGKTMSFAELTKGKVVFLNFWATWCGPCRKEIPDIIKIKNGYSDKDIIVIGIALERDASSAVTKVSDFADKNGLNYHNFFDAKNELQAAYGGIESIPTTFLIDRTGTIKEVIIGSQDFFSFTSSLNKVLKQ